MDREQLFIDGEWQAPSGNGTLKVISPVTEECIATVPDGTDDDIDRAVAAARRSFDSGVWSRLAPEERIEAVAHLADCYEARIPEMADVITAEMGCPITFSRQLQAPGPAMMLRYFCDIAPKFLWEERRESATGDGIIVRREPVGVVGIIVPWNVPQLVIMSRLAPALIAGCSVVIKPAPETPLDSFLLAEIVEAAGLPAGVVNVVPAGREVGERLVRHPDVDKIGFTGSTVAGRRVAGICGETLKRCTLELGGKSAAVVLEDADLPALVESMRLMSFMISGQSCLANSRIVTARSRYDETVDAMTELARSLTIGDPAEETTEVGPLFAERARERVEGYLALGREEGARLVTGGGRPDGFDRGWYVEPTVFADVDNRMRISQEEIFGPVVTITPFDDEEEAVAIANDSSYGLAGSVWTSDHDRGLEVARSIRTGTIGVNGYGMDMNAPIGGFKGSGIGREMGPEGLTSYIEYKSIQPL
jgi:aldehyde dehydrogenase (NAD+)